MFADAENIQPAFIRVNDPFQQPRQSITAVSCPLCPLANAGRSETIYPDFHVLYT